MTLDNLGYPLRAFWFSCSKRLKRIIWLSNVSTLSVSGEGYTRSGVVHTKLDIYGFIPESLSKRYRYDIKKIKKKRKRKKK